jgi:sugar O-acyltransferase (sialic acid O-acetyltransferase NeuD family)
MKKFIFGAGGHGKVVLDIFNAAGIPVDGFIDSNPRKPDLFGIPIYPESELDKSAEFRIIVAIGANHSRKKIVNRLRDKYRGAHFINAIHPTSHISKFSNIGEGCVIASGSIVGPGSTLGNHVVVNTGGQVDHDCNLGDFSTVAPGVVLGGTVSVGEGAYVSIGAVVRHGLTVGDGAVVGAGAVVLNDVPALVVAYGLPCKVIRNRNENDPYL